MAEAYFKMKVRGFNIDKLLFEKFCINSSFGFFLDSNVKDFHNFSKFAWKFTFLCYKFWRFYGQKLPWKRSNYHATVTLILLKYSLKKCRWFCQLIGICHENSLSRLQTVTLGIVIIIFRQIYHFLKLYISTLLKNLI